MKTLRWMLGWVVLGLAGIAGAQGKTPAGDVPAVMLSDVHFDPLKDPAKAGRLAKAPLSEWQRILDEPASSGQKESFALLELRCGARGVDSDESLLNASLRESTRTGSGARFVTLSGDLVVHNFGCRYLHAMKTNVGYADFAEKTVNYVLGRVEAAFPRVPVYVALGNNDSSCGDYHMDPHDRFLKGTSGAVMAGLRGAKPAELRQAKADYETFGYYGVSMAALPGTRMIAFDDVFLARAYGSCAGNKEEARGATLLKWLDDELAAATKKHEKVWLMGHIPPGIDIYLTLARFRNVCGGADPEMFLKTDALANLIAKYPETVALAIFAHTHSDEIRLLHGVPVKLVASVSPVNGNDPSFAVAQVDAHGGTLRDYAAYVAPDRTGAGTWAQEYRFDETFGVDSFSGAALEKVIAGLHADSSGDSAMSKAYVRDFYPGGRSPLSLVWGQATCALGEFTAEGYRRCVCGTAAH